MHDLYIAETYRPGAIFLPLIVLAYLHLLQGLHGKLPISYVV